jgi:hypothetical protein
MTEIRTAGNCGNSPKNQLLHDLAIALASADTPRLAAIVTEDVRWLPVGNKPVSGTDAFCRAVTRFGPATAITIEHVVSHGKAGAVNGVVEFGRKQRAFCLVVEFNSAKGSEVSKITSYSIPLT